LQKVARFETQLMAILNGVAGILQLMKVDDGLLED